MKKLILVSLLLCGCSSYQTKVEQKWVGKSINDVIAKAGVPTRTISMSNGGKAYQWDIGNQDNGNHCNTSFVTDSSDTIVSVTSHGKCNWYD